MGIGMTRFGGRLRPLVAIAGAAVLAATACGALPKTTAFASPGVTSSSERQAGGITVTGGLQSQFLYHQPPECSSFVQPGELLLNLNNNIGTVVLEIQHLTTPGAFAIDLRYSDGPVLQITGSYGSWSASSGSITVTEMTDQLYGGTVDAQMTYEGSSAHALTSTTAAASGTWACARSSSQTAPPAVLPPTPSAVPAANQGGQPGGVTLSGGFDAQFLYQVPPSCTFADPTKISVTFNSTVMGQFALGIGKANGIGSYPINPSYNDSPWVFYQGPSGNWNGVSGVITIDSIQGNAYSGGVDAQMTYAGSALNKPRSSAESVTGTWACSLP